MTNKIQSDENYIKGLEMEEAALMNAFRIIIAGYLYDTKAGESEKDKLLNAIRLMRKAANDYVEVVNDHEEEIERINFY